MRYEKKKINITQYRLKILIKSILNYVKYMLQFKVFAVHLSNCFSSHSPIWRWLNLLPSLLLLNKPRSFLHVSLCSDFPQTLNI